MTRHRLHGIAWLAAASAFAACGRVRFEVHDDAGDAGGVGWWDPAWGYRKPLVIDHTRVAGDLAEFPVLVEIVDPELSRAQPDGRDLAFAIGDVPLAYELESFSQPTGNLIAWIKVPALSAATDTIIDLYYGNPNAVAPSNAATVWSKHFTGVYHFGGGGTLDVRDATGVNNGVNNGGAQAGDIAMINGSAKFNGGPTISAPTTGVDTSPGGLNTVTFWVNYAAAFGKGPVAFVNGGQVYDFWFEANGCVGFNTENGEVLGTTKTPLDHRWVYIAAVFFNGVPDPSQNALYLDGASQTLTACAAGAPNSRTVGGVVDWGGNPTYEITGTLDEARIANVGRTPAWLATEYANQSDPLGFIAVGAEQRLP